MYVPTAKSLRGHEFERAREGLEGRDKIIEIEGIGQKRKHANFKCGGL